MAGRIMYISDIHFGHSNVIGFDHRPFNDVTEMDHMLMEYWNMKVNKEDTIYIIGDFCYRSDKGPVWFLQRLKGKKHLVVGNHDHVIMKNPQALSYFEEVDKMMYVSDNNRQVFMCHYPMAEWNAYYRGSYHVYGHIHNKLSDTCLIMRNRRNAYNAAACINGYMPVTLDEMIGNNKRFVLQSPLSWEDLPPSDLRF